MADHVGASALSAQVAFGSSAIATPDGLSASSANNGTKVDAEKVLKLVFDATSEGIRAVLVAASSADYGTILNSQHVWKGVYDPDIVAIRMVMV
jgi:hypothetical protein